MLNKTAIIVKGTFSIENVPFTGPKERVFLEVFEEKEICRVTKGGGMYKCLKIETRFDSKESWVLQKISSLFSKQNISIFAFTTIDYGYFFYEEKFQNTVEKDILRLI